MSLRVVIIPIFRLTVMSFIINSEFIYDKTHSKIEKEGKLDEVIGPLKTLMKVLYLTIC